DDQPVVADQVVRAGAGVRVKFARVRADDLRDAVRQALEDRDLRAAAGRLSADFATYGGATAAATALEGLLASEVQGTERIRVTSTEPRTHRANPTT
ncbi:MAG: hypothetical protein LT071_11130, partial [Nocardioides sp.]|nr:hypothetical protein [Nocardioides sp.]